MAMADVVIGVTASPVDTTALQYARMHCYAPAATFTLAETAARLAREGGARVHAGPIVTAALFYDPDPDNVARWRRTGHLAIEMEAAMLYTVAAVNGVEALAMMTVSDLVTEESSTRISDDELRRGVDDMIRIACRVAVG
jgi:purine-nucleoside phosphorylase